MLENRRSNKVVNIRSTKMMKKFFAGVKICFRDHAGSSGHPRLLSRKRRKTWMPGTSQNKSGHDAVFVDRQTAASSSRLTGDGLAERGLRRGQPRDRHAIGRARDIIQSDLVAERDRRGIAAVLAANADLETRAGLAPALNADLYQFADAVAIHRDERIDHQDSLGDVGAEESGGVIAADAVGGLRQVVGAERKELRRAGDIAGHQAGARQ